MRRLALGALIIVAVIAVASQFALPPIAEDRAADRLTDAGGSADVSISALPISLSPEPPANANLRDKKLRNREGAAGPSRPAVPRAPTSKYVDMDLASWAKLRVSQTRSASPA